MTGAAGIKPAVPKPMLLLLAGCMWLGVGMMLLSLAVGWLKALPGWLAFRFWAAGGILSLLVHHFGFLKVADKNVNRILPMTGTRCVFSFISWKSYLLVAGMIALGAILRHSPIPKPYLSVLYIGIGLALILSSIRYLRVLLMEIKKSTV